MNIPTDKLQSLPAEAAVIASMILNPKCVYKVWVLLDSRSFVSEPNKIIFNALMRMSSNKIPIDAVALRDELKKTNNFEKIGGLEYLKRVLDSVPTAANVLHYTQIVKERQKFRELGEIVCKIERIFECGGEVDEQIQEIQDIALGITKSKVGAEYFYLCDEVDSVAEEIKLPVEENKEIISTGFRSIDYLIKGCGRGELLIIAGRPGMGKSALALQIALNMAQRGMSVIFFTLEMKHRPLIRRALRKNTADELRVRDIIIHEAARTAVQQIAFIKNRRQTHKIDAVFIDYLQLMNIGRKIESRAQEISVISRELKLAAGSENVPIIALSQLNREVDKRPDHRPRLSDLRESGSLEQDADTVMLLYRAGYYTKQSDPNATQDGETELIIAKNRDGRTGIAELVFLDEHVTFADKAPEFFGGQNE